MPRAALMTGTGLPLEVWDLEQDPPGANEVAVRIVASGVCHSDLNRLNRGTDHLPLVLGHEGAGVVEEVGPGVRTLVPGDHVVLSFKPVCGECWYCRVGQTYLCTADAPFIGAMPDGTARLHHDGQDVWQLGSIGTYSERSVVPVRSTAKLPKDIPLKLAALLGCGVMTGFGAAINTADIKPGDTVAVLGCGGVGLNAVQGARVCGASEVIAIDTVQWKLDLARRFGATTVIDASSTDAVEAVRELTAGRGVDHAFEVVGSPGTIDQTIAMTRPGGETIMVGVTDNPISLVPRPFIHAGKTLKGSVYGACNFQQDVLKLVNLYQKGMLLLDELVSRELKLDDINEGFDAIVRGEVARSVVVL
jgi:NDMA-dependent alcohol dehydrogenase